MITFNRAICADTIFLPRGKDYCKFFLGGKGSVCEKCYAKKGRFCFSKVNSKHLNNLKKYTTLTSKDKITYISSEINFSGLKYFRIFSSGDFQSEQDILDWVQIAKKCPLTSFWVSTRAWNDPLMLKSLRSLARLKNVCVRLSGNKIDGNDIPLNLLRSKLFTFANVFHKQDPSSLKGHICSKNGKTTCKMLKCRLCWDKSQKSVLYKLH